MQDSLGAPIKGFGEESRRGRRQHVAHTSFERNGVPHIRMRFYIQGIRNKATVHLESRKVRLIDIAYFDGAMASYTYIVHICIYIWLVYTQFFK